MNWQALNTQYGITSWTAFERKNYTVTTNTAYDFYRLDLLRNSSSVATRMSLGELRFYGTKQTPEPRMVVSTNGFIGIGTTNPQTVLDINGDLLVSGNLGEDILRIGPYVNFDGSTTNRDTFLQWMQYITSTEYRFKFKRPELNTTTWWNTNNTITNYINYTFSTINNNAFAFAPVRGGVLLPNNTIVPIMKDTTTLYNISILKDVIQINQVTQAQNFTYVGYYGGILLPNGNVVFVPNDNSYIQILNIDNTTIGTRAVSTNIPIEWDIYRGGVLLPNGNVLFVPYNYSYIGIYNPTTDTFSTILNGINMTYAYSGGVLLPDGRVVFVPSDSTRIGIYDSVNNTFSSSITGAPGSGAYDGGVLLPDGRVVFIPSNYTYIGIFNSLTNKFSTMINVTAGATTSPYFSGGVLLPDGCVAFVPSNFTNVGII